MKQRDPSKTGQDRTETADVEPNSARSAGDDPTSILTSAPDQVSSWKIPPQGTRCGRYLLLDVIGEGGMGVVCAAYDPELDRKVALKFLRPERALSSAWRMQREARALARLNHPNVLTVHDVGEFEGRTFLAMELVDGVDLQRWLKDGSRSQQEIVEAFLQAGRGLLSAHKAGLVHRDFKPGNVMITSEGRVRVLDFGLARNSRKSADESETLTLEELDRGVPSSHSADLAQTSAGAVVGTPGFMSPEQLAGRPVDAKADQYSFCASLLYALGHRDPANPSVQATTLASLPSTWQRALQRGLEPNPEDRFPDLEALLSILSSDPRRRWRRGAVWTVVALLVTSLLLWQKLDSQRLPELCRGAEARFDAVWTEARRGALRDAFQSEGKPYASEVGRVATAAFDRYRNGWIEMHTDACLATHLRGEQSSELLDLRMECLDLRLREFDALTGLLSRPGQGVIDQAIDAVGSLSPLSSCADTTALLAPVQPPKGEGKRQRVQGLRQRLAEAKALEDAGEYLLGTEKVLAVVDESESLHYWPLEAEIQLRLGNLWQYQSDPERATLHLEKALLAALAGGHDRVAAEALTQRVRVEGYLKQKAELGLDLAEHAEAILDRLGRPEELRATLADHVGRLHLQLGQLDQALNFHQQALDLRQSFLPPEDPRLARTRIRLSNVYSELRQFEAARDLLEQAVDDSLQTLGPEHPTVAKTFERLGSVVFRLGELDEALALHRRALSIKERTLGPKDPSVGVSLYQIGNVLVGRGELDLAVAQYRKTQELFEDIYGAKHPNVALAMSNVGFVQLLRQDSAGALATYSRVLALQEEKLGQSHPQVATTLLNRSEAFLLEERLQEAENDIVRALNIWNQTHDPNSFLVRQAKSILGQLWVEKGRYVRARDLLEPLLESPPENQDEPVDPVLFARIRFELARALWGLQDDQEVAKELARGAQEALSANKVTERALLQRINSWLSEQAKL